MQQCQAELAHEYFQKCYAAAHAVWNAINYLAMYFGE
jgi:hypothetical protein